MLGIIFLKELRERDGIPDLRRAARFRYERVFLPEVRPLNMMQFMKQFLIDITIK